jgi:cell division protein FtsB
MTTALRRLAYTAAIVVAGGFAVIHLRGPNGLEALLQKRRAIRALEAENKALAADNERRRLRNQDLKQKPETWDLEIRKRMEKQKEGEVQFKLPPEGPGNGSPSGPAPKTESPLPGAGEPAILP